MSFEKLEIIAKPAEYEANRWTVGWKANVDGKLYGQWIEIPYDETMMRAALEIVERQAFRCIESIVQERELKGEE